MGKIISLYGDDCGFGTEFRTEVGVTVQGVSTKTIKPLKVRKCAKVHRKRSVIFRFYARTSRLDFNLYPQPAAKALRKSQSKSSFKLLLPTPNLSPTVKNRMQ